MMPCWSHWHKLVQEAGSVPSPVLEPTWVSAAGPGRTEGAGGGEHSLCRPVPGLPSPFHSYPEQADPGVLGLGSRVGLTQDPQRVKLRANRGVTIKSNPRRKVRPRRPGGEDECEDGGQARH